MAAPNVKNPTTITGITSSVGIGTTVIVGIVTNAPASNKVYKVNSVFASNVDSTYSVQVSLSILRNDGDRYIAKNLTIPPGATQVISTKETYFYLEEGVGIRAQSSIANGVDVTVSYEEIS